MPRPLCESERWLCEGINVDHLLFYKREFIRQDKIKVQINRHTINQPSQLKPTHALGCN